MLQEAGHIKNIVVLIFQHIQCLNLTNSEVAWVVVSSRTQVQPQIIINPDYFANYLSASYDNDILEYLRYMVKVCSLLLLQLFSSFGSKYLKTYFILGLKAKVLARISQSY